MMEWMMFCVSVNVGMDKNGMLVLGMECMDEKWNV